jgi:hypothetical protein
MRRCSVAQRGRRHTGVPGVVADGGDVAGLAADLGEQDRRRVAGERGHWYRRAPPPRIRRGGGWRCGLRAEVAAGAMEEARSCGGDARQFFLRSRGGARVPREWKARAVNVRSPGWEVRPGKNLHFVFFRSRDSLFME